jgi:WD40 repeat protein
MSGQDPVFDEAYEAAVSGDGEFIISASEFSAARLWDVRSGKLLAEISSSYGPQQDRRVTLRHGNGELLLSAIGTKAMLIEAGTGKVIVELGFGEKQNRTRHEVCG